MSELALHDGDNELDALVANDLLDTEIGLAYLDALDMLREVTGNPIAHNNMAWYIAWKRHHPNVREQCGLPKTLKLFCRNFLGISQSSVSQWRVSHPWLEAYIRRRGYTGRKILDQYADDVYHALGQSAANPDHRHAPDRRTYLQMQGELDGDGGNVNILNTTDNPYERVLAKATQRVSGDDTSGATSVSDESE
ncbi:MAG: hypothetical protein M9928_15660 [Anaerolineae bacterium]|nr:hypothetical protein [Anaerolineae bacterium]MCO5194550.1 hypothetical protein [Anaerolineae bacterium]MCO5199623.1 hypothetical protein [Anaerolineae bacterium]MCO5206473.1 hypothetical protein [Anaerolineae bacterium]